MDVSIEERGETAIESVKDRLVISESSAVKTKASNETFIASVLKARAECADDAEIMKDCCVRLQAHNRRLKQYVAIYDSQTVNEAMNGGFVGLGCNDRKLIAALCTRTKSQLTRTRKQYWGAPAVAQKALRIPLCACRLASGRRRPSAPRRAVLQGLAWRGQG